MVNVYGSIQQMIKSSPSTPLKVDPATDHPPINRSAVARWSSTLCNRFSALLFDLDGTLVDSMPVHYQAYRTVFRRHGIELKYHDFLLQVGAPARQAIPQFLNSAGHNGYLHGKIESLHLEKKKIFRILVKRAPLSPLPAAAFLSQRKGKKIALVSSGNRAGVLTIIEKMGWGGIFDAVISGDDVQNGKPHPEPYLRAAKLLDVKPCDCLVFEDTRDGVEAARAAGMRVVDVGEWAADE
ncbi:HAD-IA family hydrolase [Altererythrobacter salegens]|uniref:HAD-IA family hydrolase n=1 Tax=Croceibacterium salegens TaxID=1737568 RepID=A0A6I4SY05_9SPHN|nr:HAD family phosphatase [Croceibacterium salegens]MXO60723.1 HAD-IA family hydrolase [Croceibacterium salegens]